ncbi:MAG TPA: BON domain-containing protein [Gemmataceae bacterium]|jgi:hypothetical protein|nr:BON domain-containing protein [Gemmataceae bacterium]
MATAVLPRSAAEALRDCSLSFLRHLNVTENDQEIVLSGRVGSYYYKQLAQEAIMPVLGDRRLRNLIAVE